MDNQGQASQSSYNQDIVVSPQYTKNSRKIFIFLVLIIISLVLGGYVFLLPSKKNNRGLAKDTGKQIGRQMIRPTNTEDLYKDIKTRLQQVFK